MEPVLYAFIYFLSITFLCPWFLLYPETRRWRRSPASSCLSSSSATLRLWHASSICSAHESSAACSSETTSTCRPPSRSTMVTHVKLRKAVTSRIITHVKILKAVTSWIITNFRLLQNNPMSNYCPSSFFFSVWITCKEKYNSESFFMVLDCCLLSFLFKWRGQ